MYDTDEEIRLKRRKLIIKIAVVISIIILLLIILLVLKFGKGKKKSTDAGELSCELEVIGNVKPDNKGVYHEGITVEFKSITPVSDQYTITKKTIGVTDNSKKNTDSFSISKSGVYHLYGYLQDSAGNKGKCKIDLEVSLVIPSCELAITNGTLGDNSWYKSDVEVGFAAKESNSSAQIVKYYIEEEKTDLDTTEAVKSEAPEKSMDTYVVKANQKTNLIGYVIDSDGNEGTCRLSVYKDSTKPTCTLKVNSGTKNADGQYTDNPEIGLAEAKDDVSGIAHKGVGVSKNYAQQTYKVTAEGKTKVFGYVKDKAGNEGECSIEVERPTATSTPDPTPDSTPDPTPTPAKYSDPRCNITLSVPQSETGGRTFSQDVKAKITYWSSNGATVVDYGLAESQTYNQKTEITVSGRGNHNVYGIVKDSYGNVGTCSTGAFTIEYADLLINKVSPGDYVAYDAGTWTTTSSTEQKSDGFTWGYVSGQSKQTGVRCKTGDGSPRNGWIVLGSYNGGVVLISAGTPECIYHKNTSSTTLINVMDAESEKYINSNYAYGSSFLQCGSVSFECNRDVYLTSYFKIGTSYWIGQNGAGNILNGIDGNGNKATHKDESLGFRPIIYLYPEVKTTGKSNGVWIIK